MKQYTYYFNDGTTSTVEVTDEMYKELIKWDNLERNNNRANTRRHISISDMNDKTDCLEDPNGDPFDTMMRTAQAEKIQAALDQLTDSQRELVDLVFIQGRKAVDIAEEQGVCFQAISNRLERIRKKLQKLLQ